MNLVTAQIPVLTSGLNPALWDNYSGYRVDTSAIDLFVTGADQVWSVPSTSITAGSFTNITGHAVSSTPYASSFPTSDVAIQDSYLGTYSYFDTQYFILELKGYGAVEGVTTFTNSAVLMTFPFTYHDTVNDDLSGTTNVVYPFAIKGTSTTVADAYGTLTLPSGSYTVLRVKSFQSAVSSNIGGTITTNVTTYYWYSELHKYPLLQVDITQTIGTGIFNPNANSYRKRAFITTPELLGLNDKSENSNFSFYPNPANGKANLSFFSGKAALINVSLTNVLGQEWSLISEKRPAGSYNDIINLDHFTKGVYTLKFSLEGTLSQKKIIIQ